MRRSRTIPALFGAMLALCLWLPGGQGHAAEMVWKFKSEHRDTVSVELYSQDRNKTWPGGGRAFRLKGGKTQRFRIECEPGERICFGAWARRDTSTFWGAGFEGHEACQRCCATCGSRGLMTQILKP
ncbi:MAG: hypothetical protein OEN23_06880 [Paracoccaceae bacterium]|nr:hypothetical protein [Paracoccaceae bacterium]